MIHSANDAFFDVTRSSAGKYAISVYGSDGLMKLSENDGMLILSVASSVPDSTTLADRKFLSYQYNSGTGNFDVESREVVAILQPQPPSENQFGDELGLRDVNFYFAWVSFTNPLAPFLTGDYNNNGKVDGADYVAWRNAGPTDNLPNDATAGTVDQSDYDAWRTNFGSSVSLAGGAGLGSGQSVPEPTSLALFGFVVESLLAIRIRRSRMFYAGRRHGI